MREKKKKLVIANGLSALLADGIYLGFAARSKELRNVQYEVQVRWGPVFQKYTSCNNIMLTITTALYAGSVYHVLHSYRA